MLIEYVLASFSMVWKFISNKFSISMGLVIVSFIN
jgi:hypothetical protein